MGQTLTEKYAADCIQAGEQPKRETIIELMKIEYILSPRKRKIDSLIGKTVMSIDYTGTESGAIEITFTDQTTLYIDAAGDDMAHTEIVLNAEAI